MRLKTPVILAAGIGSRFPIRGGVKQPEPVDDHGHLIIDNSIHEAVVFPGFLLSYSSYSCFSRNGLVSSR